MVSENNSPSPQATPSPARGPQYERPPWWCKNPLCIGDDGHAGPCVGPEASQIDAAKAAPSPSLDKLREAVEGVSKLVAEIDGDKGARRRAAEILVPVEWLRAILAAPAGVDAGLREEIEVLRSFGNKDCTAMADAELERRRKERVAARPHPEEQGEATDLEALERIVLGATPMGHGKDCRLYTRRKDRMCTCGYVESKELHGRAERALKALRSRTPSQGWDCQVCSGKPWEGLTKNNGGKCPSCGTPSQGGAAPC
jgi:hypothetical protein